MNKNKKTSEGNKVTTAPALVVVSEPFINPYGQRRTNHILSVGGKPFRVPMSHFAALCAALAAKGRWKVSTFGRQFAVSTPEGVEGNVIMQEIVNYYEANGLQFEIFTPVAKPQKAPKVKPTDDLQTIIQAELLKFMQSINKG